VSIVDVPDGHFGRDCSAFEICIPFFKWHHSCPSFKIQMYLNYKQTWFFFMIKNKIFYHLQWNFPRRTPLNSGPFQIPAVLGENRDYLQTSKNWIFYEWETPFISEQNVTDLFPVLRGYIQTMVLGMQLTPPRCNLYIDHYQSSSAPEKCIPGTEHPSCTLQRVNSRTY